MEVLLLTLLGVGCDGVAWFLLVTVSRLFRGEV